MTVVKHVFEEQLTSMIPRIFALGPKKPSRVMKAILFCGDSPRIADSKQKSDWRRLLNSSHKTYAHQEETMAIEIAVHRSEIK